MKRKLTALLLVLVLALPGFAAGTESGGVFADVLRNVDYGDGITYVVWYGDDAEAAVRESFPEYDGSGSLVFTPGVSRKTVVVPRLTVTLEGWTKQAAQEAAEPAESSAAGQE